MEILTKDEILAHCRLDEGLEDAYIEHLGCTAEEMVNKYLNRSWADLAQEEGKVPEAVKHACYLIIGSLYKNREADVVQQQAQNRLFVPLIVKYRKL